MLRTDLDGVPKLARNNVNQMYSFNKGAWNVLRNVVKSTTTLSF